MKTALLIGVVVSTLISTIIILYFVRRWVASRPVEGFAEDEDDDSPDQESNPNVLISLVGRLKRMSGFLMTSSNWVDRIQMAGLSPVELARRHIKSNTQTE